MDKNRVEINLGGCTYTIAGEKSEDKIKEIAKFVDDELKRVSRQLNCNVNYRVAVLTCINITEKLMENGELNLVLQDEKSQLESDVKHYIDLWEESKNQMGELKDALNTANELRDQEKNKHKDIEQKCSDFENAYFDLQMENVRLKNEIENLKRFEK
ncbi:MAG: cell division protein ZapA [Peptostreptococcaceae bacterium]|nr:cell division protein ZapA [Peptostreptococcaceae bacterium]